MSQVLIASINPSLKVPVSENEFSEEVAYLFGPYMIVASNIFVMGADKVEFQVYYGNLEKKDKDDPNLITGFAPIKKQKVILAGTVVDEWGTNDSEILYAIAEVVGTSVTNIIPANIDLPFVY